MRQLLLVSAFTLGLIALSGCSQSRSAWNSTQCATQGAWKSTQGATQSAWKSTEGAWNSTRGVRNSTQSAWNKGKREVNRVTGCMKKQRAVQKAPVVEACANTTTRCGPPPAAVAQPSECLTWAQPIYPNHCGGDNGIGRGGTGAFKIP